MCGEHTNWAAVYGVANIRFGVCDSVQSQSIGLSGCYDSRLESQLIFRNGSVVDRRCGCSEKFFRNVSQVRVAVLHDDDRSSGEGGARDDLAPAPIQCVDALV